MTPRERRASATYLVERHGLAVARACATLGISRTFWYQRPSRRDDQDAEVIAALNRTVEKHPRWGFWKCYDYLRLNGQGWNHKRVLRVYRQLKLNLPRRVKRRIQRQRVPLEIVAEVNASWSLDFMYDSLYCGKRFRTLNVLDEGVRECLAIEVDTSLRAERVVKVLDCLKGWRGTPRMIRLDNVLTQKSSTFFEQHSSLQFQLDALAAARHKSRIFARCRGSLRSFLTSASLRLLAPYREAVASPH